MRLDIRFRFFGVRCALVCGFDLPTYRQFGDHVRRYFRVRGMTLVTA